MPKLKFYDVKAKKSFMTDKFRLESRKSKSGRVTNFAIAVSPLSGIESFRIVDKDFKK